ncbi:GGDEF/HDGYP domain-containing response regulator [Blautia stercoris]
MDRVEKRKTTTILIVDDSELNRVMLAAMLGENYEILEASDGVEALSVIQKYETSIDLVLLDIVMPGMDGFEVLKVMNQKHWIDTIPVIMISAENDTSYMEKAYELGATDYIKRPYESYIIHRRITNTLMLYEKQRRLLNMVEEQIYEKEKNNSMMIKILGHIVEFRNGESGPHVHHVQTMTRLLLQCLMKKTNSYNLTDEDVLIISTASALHDIGKIMIDEKILNKPGKLTKEEFEIMKTHSMLGASILKELPTYQKKTLVSVAYEICRWHHERYDGKGYPDGLKGEEIPISAQVVALADVYDALTSERCYKKAFSKEKAMEMILDGQCGAFNPLLLECLKDIEDIIEVSLDMDAQMDVNPSLVTKVTEELLDSRIVEKASYSSWRLEKEQEKHKFFTAGLEEIQFEYDSTIEAVTLSEYGAKLLGLREVIIKPEQGEETFLGSENIKTLTKALHQTTPVNSEIRMKFLANYPEGQRWCQVIAKSLWSREEEPKYIGVLGRIIDIHEKDTIYFDNNKDVTKGTKAELKEMVQQLEKVFDSVRLIDVESYEVIPVREKKSVYKSDKCYNIFGKKETCKNCVSRKATVKKDQCSKIEFIGENIYETIAKYIEIEGHPYVLEMIYKMRDEMISDPLGRNDFIEGIKNYNQKFYRDVLTGVYNRRYYDEYAKNMTQMNALALIDGDNFGIINEKYGHAAGNIVIYHIAKMIENCIRCSDVLIRYEGDKFLLLMENISSQMFEMKLKRIAEAINNMVLEEYPHIRFSVTIGGVHGVLPLEEAFKEAYQLMEQGKKEKNHVVMKRP